MLLHRARTTATIHGGGTRTPRVLFIVLSKSSIAFGSAPRREADSQPISQLARPAVSQTERTVRVFCPWQTRLQAVGRKPGLRAIGGQMVMQATSDFLVGGSNPGRANVAAPLPMTIDLPVFKPPT